MLNARLMQAYAMVNVSINLLELRAWTYQVYIALSDRSLIENGIDKKDRLYSTDGSLHYSFSPEIFAAGYHLLQIGTLTLPISSMYDGRI